MTVDEGVSLDALPMPLRWVGQPAAWSVADGGLRIVAGARTDWFVDPQGVAEPKLDAPVLLGPTSGDFMLSARVTVEFAATYDAGVLVVHADDSHWAKLCFEYSPEQEPMVVSVVTRDVSDDCNSFVVDGDSVWLRIARLGPALAFHASLDGRRWSLVRHFALGSPREPSVGFLAQSPTGDGCASTFGRIEYRPDRLEDLRSGV